MKYNFSISDAARLLPHTEITLITESNYNDYLYALKIILHAVQAEIAKNEAILQKQHELLMEETADSYYEDPL